MRVLKLFILLELAYIAKIIDGILGTASLTLINFNLTLYFVKKYAKLLHKIRENETEKANKTKNCES